MIKKIIYIFVLIILIFDYGSASDQKELEFGPVAGASVIGTNQNPWPDTAIVISSCDKYSCLWPGFFHYFYKYFPEINTKLKNVPIYLLSNTKTWDDDRVKVIFNPDEKCWGESMKNALSKISQKYFLFILDDLFLKELVDFNLLTEHFNFMKQVGSPYIQVFPTRGYENCAPIEQKHLIRRKLNRGGWCKTSLHVAFWERESFFNQLTGEESIWPFEGNPIAEEDTRPYLVVSKKMINYWNVVNAGKVDPHMMVLFKKECSALTCNLPNQYDLITNPERLSQYGGIEGNHLFWSNLKRSIDMLKEAIEKKANFLQVIEIARKRRAFLAINQNIAQSEKFQKVRFQNPLPVGITFKTSCDYPLMRETYQQTFKDLHQTFGWTPLKEGYEYTYSILSALEWLLLKDPLISAILCFTKTQEDKLPNTIFKLYDIEQMKDGTYPIDERYLEYIRKDQLKDLNIASLSVRKADTKEQITQILYVFDKNSNKDLSDVPFAWIAPTATQQDLTLLANLFQKAVDAKEQDDFIKASLTFYFYFIQKRPLVRGNGSVGKWILDALYETHSIPAIKTRYFAELEQICMTSLTVEDFLNTILKF
ncbi:MAG: hypothetical protein KBD31_05180 [Proteobacteria bacterium]|nr:hypothetical protein [Pseudomonadota bacterium]